MSIFEIRDGQVVLNLEEVTSVPCKCGHTLLHHYFAEGCCDGSRCDCLKFEQEAPDE